MNALFCIFCLVLTLSCVRDEPLDYVSPYIGSDGHGHVFVGASVPHGMVQVGPQNIFKGWDWCSGYHYSDSVMIGFSHTHLNGTGCKDLGDIILMPFNGEIRTESGSQDDISGTCSSYYSHDNETVSPYYYSIKLDNGISAEMTASARVAFHRFSFPARNDRNILINLYDGNGFKSVSSSVRKLDDHTVVGYRTVKGWAIGLRTLYFALKTDVPIETMPVFSRDSLVGYDSLDAKGVKAVMNYGKKIRDVAVKVSISSVSTDNALMNIGEEIPHWNFSKVMNSTKALWEMELDKIVVTTGSEADKIKFYTAMYHTLISPTVYCDVNGEYKGMDGKVYRTDSLNYSTFSCWDTYRALHPLYTIIQRSKVDEMVNSMLSVCDQQGRLPIWLMPGGETNTMPGYGSVPIVCDAVLKDIPGIDRKRVFSAVMKTSENPDQDGIDYVLGNEYIPADKEVKATSMALEYAVADWGISAVAGKLGYEDAQARFCRRAHYWKHYFDDSIGLIRPKMSDGTWASPYNPEESVHGKAGYFTEGTGWQYTFMIPQDPYGLIEAMGGDEAFCVKLDSLFTVPFEMDLDASMDITGLIGQFAHGNEPSHHVPYLYTYAGKQWKTAEIVRYILDNFYTTAPDGIVGNEDCGQMSAWYILSSVGFYQLNPSCGEFVFASPVFDKVKINLDNGKEFIITVHADSPDDIYIRSVKLNGQPYEKSYIGYADIMNGGTLSFIMGKTPNYEFGYLKTDRPRNIVD